MGQKEEDPQSHMRPYQLYKTRKRNFFQSSAALGGGGGWEGVQREEWKKGIRGELAALKKKKFLGKGKTRKGGSEGEHGFLT